MLHFQATHVQYIIHSDSISSTWTLDGGGGTQWLITVPKHLEEGASWALECGDEH